MSPASMLSQCDTHPRVTVGFVTTGSQATGTHHWDTTQAEPATAYDHFGTSVETGAVASDIVAYERDG